MCVCVCVCERVSTTEWTLLLKTKELNVYMCITGIFIISHTNYATERKTQKEAGRYSEDKEENVRTRNSSYEDMDEEDDDDAATCSPSSFLFFLVSLFVASSCNRTLASNSFAITVVPAALHFSRHRS